MNKLLKRGLSVWLIFIKNRLAGAIMMFVSGVMMAIAGFSGNGNDTKTLPAVIALAGAILGFWSIYRLGYIKSNIDKARTEENRAIERSFLYPQIFETSFTLSLSPSVSISLSTETLQKRYFGVKTALNSFNLIKE